MFERTTSPKLIEKRNWILFPVGFIFGIISIILPFWIFANSVLEKYSSIFSILFCVMFTIPIIYRTINFEESKDEKNYKPLRLLKEHSKAIICFLWLFLGITFAFSISYILLDSPVIYQAQIETYCSLNSVNEFCMRDNTITGNATLKMKTNLFSGILKNNLTVLIFSIIFSILFWAGGTFIIIWNASVIATAIAIFSKHDLANFHLSLLRYLIHGIPEIAGYFVGMLAGGIIGISIIKKEWKSKKRLNTILKDILLLIIIAVIILVIASLIEVYIITTLI
jgi:uncharacterized membrane protein SpoIIM required for sporulation